MIAKIESFVEIEITEKDLDINKLDDKIYKASLKAGQEIFKKSLDEINNYVINKKRDKDGLCKKLAGFKESSNNKSIKA